MQLPRFDTSMKPCLTGTKDFLSACYSWEEPPMEFYGGPYIAEELCYQGSASSTLTKQPNVQLILNDTTDIIILWDGSSFHLQGFTLLFHSIKYLLLDRRQFFFMMPHQLKYLRNATHVTTALACEWRGFFKLKRMSLLECKTIDINIQKTSLVHEVPFPSTDLQCYRSSSYKALPAFWIDFTWL